MQSKSFSVQEKITSFGNKLHQFMLKTFDFRTSSGTPLLKIESLTYQYAKASNLKFQVIDLNFISINPTEEDFCVYIPMVKYQIKKISESLGKDKNKSTAISSKIFVQIQQIAIHLITEEGSVLASA